MAVTIYKPGEKHPDEGLSYAERQLKARQERRARLDAHREAQDAYIAEQKEAKAMGGAPENKMLPGPATKAELEAMDVADLKALAEERKVTVVRTDGREDLDPRKSDYIAALGD